MLGVRSSERRSVRAMLGRFSRESWCCGHSAHTREKERVCERLEEQGEGEPCYDCDLEQRLHAGRTRGRGEVGIEREHMHIEEVWYEF